MHVKHVTQVPEQVTQAGEGVSFQVLWGSGEVPNFFMRRFRIRPGGSMPRHKNQVEHVQYVLQGRARIGIGDEEYEVKAGDAIYIPAGAPHWYRNIGNEDFVFLCMVPNQPDTLTLLEDDAGTS